MLDKISFFGGLIFGAVLMFLLDPQGGRRRRAVARDKAVHYGHVARRTTAKKARHARNRAHGMIAEAWSARRAA